jgi:hypothetical protein
MVNCPRAMRSAISYTSIRMRSHPTILGAIQVAD